MERELIEWLRAEFPVPRHARLGIGDDCAILPPAQAEWAITCDSICDQVHFDSAQVTPEQIGRKALAVNLSDLAAMGALPRVVVVSLTLPRTADLAYVQRLYRGMGELIDRYQLDICGGDTTVAAGPLVISLTALGELAETGAWRIDQAQSGDRILVTGQLGGSLAGHHLDFEPRVDFARQWRDTPHVRCCTDISDSLSLDLAKVARASGTGFELDSARIPLAPAAAFRSQETGHPPLHHALFDGEDFELLVVATPENAAVLVENTPGDPGLTEIGRITAGPDYLLRTAQRVDPLQPAGYEHRLASGPVDLGGPETEGIDE